MATIVKNIAENVTNTINELRDAITFGATNRLYQGIGLTALPMYEKAWLELSETVSTIMGIPIGDYCNLNDRMYGYMTRLMLINLWEHNTTLNMLCDIRTNQASGNSETITHEAQIPSYTRGNNYLVTTRQMNADEKIGIGTTNVDIWNGTYPKTKNLFPDDNDQRAGDFTDMDVWETPDPNSILYKTKCLFTQRKINTLISRFGTDADGNPNPDKVIPEGSARTRYGYSHGRNLLKKEAENGGVYLTNGYNNPYCRVWTHHYQYDRFNKTMRPFQNNFEDVKKSHNWGTKFLPDEVEVEKPISNIGVGNQINLPYKVIDKYGWKSDEPRWDRSVLNGRGDGLINITPHFSGGGAKNIHTKDCMFSIENLAWKDYDPYSFETALSWEQRGPLGGRIMWFPPYGLTFNETSQAQWSSNTFIGRGEDVYTYVNTKRTGTLQFYMIVDHPSVLDYVTWYEANKDNVSETDILRYFAGCDPNDSTNPDSLLHYVEPTPLTDEATTVNTQIIDTESLKTKPKDKATNSSDTIQFMVYFPNNYSGSFDVYNNKTGVEFIIKYLLSGKNAHEYYTLKPNGEPISNPLTEFNSTGYEMEDLNGITDENEDMTYAIVGNKETWETNRSPLYVPDPNEKTYRYRIDGEYKVPSDRIGGENTRISNTFAQDLKVSESYKDTRGYRLNLSMENQKSNYSDGKISNNGTDNAYTFAEVIKALAEVNNKSEIIKLFEGRTLFTNSEEQKNFDDRVEALKNKFNEAAKSKKTIETQYTGFANSQGKNANQGINKERNDYLSRKRAETTKEIVSYMCKSFIPITEPSRGGINSDVIIVAEKDESAKNPKLYRSAICTMTFKTEDTVSATDTEENDTQYRGYYKVENETFAGKPVYTLEKDPSSRWLLVDEDENGNGNLVKIPYDEAFIKDSASEMFWYNAMFSSKDGVRITDDLIKSTDTYKETLYNKVRYDQEYHFFRRMEAEKPLIFTKLMEKLQYFDPAFHSMTPEGFNARCTFLNQCTRQGNTVGVSDDQFRLSASNMAFGRPPFCVLRIGDFYNQLILIESVNINYDTSGGIVWDLNDEGVGVQPMLAQVSLNFTFIGGSDMGGAVRRLQNAQSFNFYANTSLYDNRADRVNYDYDIDLTMGGAGKGTLNTKTSKFQNVGIYKPNGQI